MTFMTLIKTVVVAGTLAIASVASAATPLTFDSKGVAFFNNSLTGNFTDDFSFEIAKGLDGQATVTAIAGLSSFFNVSFTDAFIYNAADSTKTRLASNSSTVPFVAGLATGTLHAGTYILELSGVTLPTGGSYAGQLTLITTPVPEPETYAMFLAGLGLMGAIARRRKNI
jgi:hypothetical protein